MPLTRPGPPTPPAAVAGAPEGARRPPVRGEAPPPARTGAAPPDEPVLRALRWEALLGDPDDPANPYGRAALAAAGGADLPRPDPAWGPLPPGAGARGCDEPAGQLVRVLRPLLRRDTALAHDWVIRPLLTGAPRGTAEPPAAAGHRARLAELLVPAALVAATGDLLRTTARHVAALAPGRPGARQWQPVLAAVFADLLACESLTAVALRALDTADGGGDVLPAATGYVVPRLVGGLLGDLELVLNDSLSGPAATEREALARQSAIRTAARVDRTAVASGRARLIRLLPRLADASEQPGHPAPRELFRLGAPTGPGTGPHDADACGGGHGGGRGPAAPAPDATALAAVLPAAAGRPDRAGDTPARAALTRFARRLATEQRALRGPSRSAAATASDPAARALADRQALLLLAAVVLGVQETAAEDHGGFLGGCDWALLALERVVRRLGVPLPGDAPDPVDAVWTELAERIRAGVDCDVYGTRLLW
uniref:hypothetical protein n=1 Tax=Streptomyces sp. SAT1 TaxID=1849967 RepID=UPI0007F9B424|nr:hypothetical protein [Streptomyces sp. SAT1]ANO42216.1 hypothetical protein A8713_033715 [Streptomyces sp. SAT1]